ncbi:hypothetical protein [Pseudogemmobacter sp. W21_MBD1_M6]|uniref:hypothetical protein n=1 Tax=Pseudogemmobacter sp. W21_MBD1_M6 TaxID=3240271 RepID=UPI003F971748
MTKPPSSRQLRLPVKYVDGVWESAYGGVIPVSPDAKAALILDRSSISDPLFLERMETKNRYKVLEQGTELRVMLSIKEKSKIEKPFADHLINGNDMRSKLSPLCFDGWSPVFLHLVRVTLGKPHYAQMRTYDEEYGGLWLMTHGPQAIGLQSTSICLPEPFSDSPVQSLNHAYTKLSETYEPWRLSHTGNIYTRVLYQEKNERWYPLDLLRNEALDKVDEEIAHTLWDDFMKKSSPAPQEKKKS